MAEYTVTVYRRQTFVIEAENVEDAHQLCLDGRIIEDEITDIVSEVQEPTLAEIRASRQALRDAAKAEALSQMT
jgi:hypothetical protein